MIDLSRSTAGMARKRGHPLRSRPSVPPNSDCIAGDEVVPAKGQGQGGKGNVNTRTSPLAEEHTVPFGPPMYVIGATSVVMMEREGVTTPYVVEPL